jgi:hypothetical protein
VELHTTFDAGASVPQTATLRFDLVEEDWELNPETWAICMIKPFPERARTRRHLIPRR